MRRVVLALALVATGCALEERSDYLIGRACSELDPASCDSGQACLPHGFDGVTFTDHRCRDRASFEPIAGHEAPTAYCDDDKQKCPGDLVCNADRVRADAATRRRVCKLPTDIFAPPLDGGT